MSDEIKVEQDNAFQDRFSRQIGTFGMETMGKLIKFKILIVGMRGLGLETAKNIILSGPHSVEIYDPIKVTQNDLTTNFYITEEDINKKRRDEACLLKLSELNPYTKVSIFEVEQNSDFNIYIKNFCEKIKNMNVVVFTEMQPMNFLMQIDEYCRQNKIKFIYGVNFGLVGYIFTDFGQEHIIFDDNGEDLGTYLVKNITKDKNGLVTIDNIQGTNNLKIGDGDYVKFKEVEGMTELNDENKDFQIVFESYKSFFIGDTSKFNDYKKGGIIYPIKKPQKKQYLNFQIRSGIPCDPLHPFSTIDATKEGRSEFLYMIFCSIHDFYCQNGFNLPELNNINHANIILENTKKLYDVAKTENKMPWFNKVQKFDEKIVLNVAKWARAQISPLAAFFGGIIAQEIIKATGKYIPIDQWLIMDFFEVVENLGDVDRTLPEKSRYLDQIAIFGNDIQNKIENSDLFLAGSGATGCEFLKNFAMMGFSTAKDSKLTVTDNDNIEISNLSRQFLFRKNDVGKSKSECSSKAVKLMNPNINIKSLQTKICDETENIFNEDFWNKQSFIINAVDSVDARKYIDSKVVSFEKCSIDSGTLGTKAHLQMIIPHKTLTYNDNAPSGKTNNIPMCMLRHFPSMIEHCIEWARDIFFGYFSSIINDVKIFFTNKNEFKNNLKKEGSIISQLDKLKLIKIHIDMIIKKDINLMIEYAIKQYTEKFDHDIQQLINNFPIDYKDKDGSDFWTGFRRFPHNIPFDYNNELCIIYIQKFIFILSHALNINFNNNELSYENIKNITSKIIIPKFINKNIKINLDDDENNKNDDHIDPDKLKNAEIELNNILNELDNIKIEKYDHNKINPEEFEKDHDENGHIDFINVCANLRALNYNIDKCDRNKTKMIAGKIIPAILTSTASIAGIVSLQLYTLFQTHDIKFLRNCFFNLSNNCFLFNEPNPPIEMKDEIFDEGLMGPKKAIPNGWNIWDKIEMKGTKTCNELINYLKEKYNVDIDIIVANGCQILLTFLPGIEEKKNKKIEDLYYEVSKKEEKKNYLLIQIVGTVSNVKIEDKEVNRASAYMPVIKYIFK